MIWETLVTANIEATEFEKGIQARIELYSHLSVNQAFKNQFDFALAILLKAIEEDKKILIFGNGGSAADSIHFAAELVCQFQKERRAIAAISLNTDPAILTAQSNDFGFSTVFSRQIEALCQPGDVVIGFTTSDADYVDKGEHSRNLLLAFKVARQKGAVNIGFFSAKTEFLLDYVDVAIVVPNTQTALIQEVHQMVIHELSKHIEQAL